jgi:hypothetical protein
MSPNLKRLQKIEAALEQLLAKEKAYLLFYRGNDPEKELQWHIDAGNYDPATQEAVIIMAWGPRPRPDPKTYRKGWTSELPTKRNMAEEISVRSTSCPSTAALTLLTLYLSLSHSHGIASNIQTWA